MKRAVAAVLDSIHPLLSAPAEAVHQLSEEGELRVEDDSELAPGHDACAVCAGQLDNPAVCKLCESVEYCCSQHLVDDAPGHATVCSALRLMRRADRLAGHAVEQAPAQSEAAAAPSEQSPVQAGAQSQAGPGQSGSSARYEIEPFRSPERLRDGWQYVVPARFWAVYPRLEDQADEQSQQQPACKRARKHGGDSEEATTSQGGTRQGAQQRDAAEDTDPGADDEAQLRLAAELAERTAVLSYAFTCCYALQSIPAAHAAVRRAASASRPLELVVLGAAGDAELGDLASWEVIAAALDQDIRILFVGPEIPEDLDGTEEQRGRVAMRFQQSTFDQAAGGRQSRQSGANPDIYFAFNPGFTCPDYEWSETVKGLARAARTSSNGREAGGGAPARPCLVVATNTRMEAQMETEWLEEYGWRVGMPVVPNPYTSLKIIQSGTLANDLYRKNAWLLVYEHHTARADRSGGRRSAKAAAKRTAKALYSALVAPVGRLLRKR